MRILSIIFLSTLLSMMACGPTHEAAFFVQGSCEECLPIIQKGVEAVSGANLVSWSTENSMALVTYRGEESVVDSIQKQVSLKGFETQFYPADEVARANLPECCRKSQERFSMPQNGHSSE